jgi:hypothetical protein
MTRFGLNDSLPNHNWKKWEPVRCAPNVFRTACYWNDTTTPQTAATQMNLWTDSSKLGIVCLYGPAGVQAPGLTDFMNSVSTILSVTPANLLIEVWNEPNDPAYGSVTEAQCRDLLTAAVKADNGRGRVIGPAANPNRSGALTYIANAYANHPACPASVHIYPQSFPWTADFDYWLGVAHYYCNNADYSKGIYITEMGLRANIYGGAAYSYAGAAFARAAAWSPNVWTAVYHRLRITDQFDFGGSLFFYFDNGLENTPLVNAIDAVH